MVGSGGVTGRGQRRPGANNGPISGSGNVGGTTSVFTCTPGVQQLVITDCGYPYASSNPLTSTVFNESEVLRAIQPSGSWPNGVVSMFYNDEHALTWACGASPSRARRHDHDRLYRVAARRESEQRHQPATGTNPQRGSERPGRFLRPMWPSLFVTDITTDPEQQGGRLAAGRPADLAERDLRLVEGGRADRRQDGHARDVIDHA